MQSTLANPRYSSWAQAYLAHLDEQARKHDVAFPGGRMRWRQFGSGRPLVLIHGGHGSWMHWARNIEALAERFSVWVPDLPGYGESDNPEQAELSSLVTTTIATLDQLVGKESGIDLVGFSFGGLVAAHVAAERQMVGNLALLGPVGHGTHRRPIGSPLSWKNVTDEAELMVRMKHNLAIQMIHFHEHIDALALLIHADSCLRNRFRSKAFSRGDSLFGALDRHAGNTLLIWGENDVTAAPAALTETLTAGRPTRRVHIVKEAGHWVQYEGADEINQLLLDWLAGRPTNANSALPLQATGK